MVGGIFFVDRISAVDLLIKTSVTNLKQISKDEAEFTLNTLSFVHGVLEEADLYAKDEKIKNRIFVLKEKIKKELEEISVDHELSNPYIRAVALLIAAKYVLDELASEFEIAVQGFIRGK